jgi:DNA invertase Pin-like site-specific DNA recombinase
MEQKGYINAVAMIRVSTAGQADERRAGIPAQREAIRRIAEARGLRILPEHQFELTDLSGAHVLDSSEYQRFMRVVAQPGITAVVTKEFSRIMRPECFDEYVILQHFVNHGIRLHLPDTVLDFSNRRDRFMAGLSAAMAGMERDEIRQRMMDGKEAMRRRGQHPSSRHTLARGIGYDREKMRWFYKEDELAVVRLIFRRFLEGERNYARLSDLTGIARSSIRIILTNPVYAGMMTYSTRHDMSPAGLYPQQDGKRAFRRKIPRTGADIIQVPTGLAPIITMDQHRYIVDTVENMRAPRAQARESAEPRFTYRGYLRCGCCRGLVYSWAGSRKKDGTVKDFYYCKSHAPRERDRAAMCSNRYMSRHILEPKLDAILAERLADPQFLTSAIHAHLQQLDRDAGADNTQALTDRLHKLELREKRIVDAFLDGNLDRFEKQNELRKVADQIDEITRQLRAVRPIAFTGDDVRAVVETFAEWPHMGIEHKRQVMAHMLSEIYVDRYAVQGVTLLVGCNSDNDSKSDA